MKKSELKKYIRENIISELSESTEDEIAKTKELTQAVQDLESAKKEAGIEENIAGDIFFVTYNNEKIIFGDSNEIIKKIEVLKLLLKQETKYNIIDVTYLSIHPSISPPLSLYVYIYIYI